MRLFLILPAAAALAACTASGFGRGLVTAPSGEPAGKARVGYSTRGGATAQLFVTLPGGETFTGPAVSGARQSLPGVAFGPNVRDVVISAPGKEWTGTILATLSAPSGRTMTCDLVEKRVGLGLEGGAIGTCTLADGQRVQIEL